jgi:hypothetical protein
MDIQPELGVYLVLDPLFYDNKEFLLDEDKLRNIIHDILKACNKLNE